MRGPPSHPLFGPLLPEDAARAARAAILLFDRALADDPDRQAETIDSLTILSDGIAPADEVTPSDLARIAIALRGRLQVGQFSALLATPREPGPTEATAELLVAWVLAASVARIRTAPDEHAIPAALRNTRLLISRDPHILSSLAPLARRLPELGDHIRKLEQSPDLPGRLRRRLAAIGYLLHCWNRDSPAIFRQSDGENRPLRQHREESVAWLTGGFRTAATTGPAEEQQVDEAVGGTTVVIAEDLADRAPGPATRGRAGRIARAAAIRALALPAEHDPMTAHEVQVLVRYLTDIPARPRSADLLASLIFGLSLEAIAAAVTPPGLSRFRLSADLDEGTGLWLDNHLPEPELIDELRRRHEDETLFLPAPQCLDLRQLGQARAAMDIPAGLRALLARPLSRGRIARYKSDWLRRAGADAAIVGFLTGVDPGRRAQMHYTAVPHTDLQRWHARYAGEALGLDLTVGSASGLYGSGIRLEAATLRALFEEQRHRLQTLRTGPVAPLARIAEAHNAFALYTLCVLYLATGHRPVAHPFELFGDIVSRQVCCGFRTRPPGRVAG